MKIENIELLELFSQTICSATDNQIERENGLQASQKSTLAEQLGSCDNILANMAKRLENHGEQNLAATLRLLEVSLNDEKLWASFEPEQHGRLLDYVYPVV